MQQSLSFKAPCIFFISTLSLWFVSTLQNGHFNYLAFGLVLLFGILLFKKLDALRLVLGVGMFLISGFFFLALLAELSEFESFDKALQMLMVGGILVLSHLVMTIILLSSSYIKGNKNEEYV